jgi:Tfp pilus assembly protein FimT
MKTTSIHHDNCQGFTLTELLLTVGIAITLILLSIPVSTNLRSLTDTNRCLSNIRQYGIALFAYLADHGSFKYWDGQSSSNSATGVPQFNKWLTEGGYLPSQEPMLRCPLGNRRSMKDVHPRYRFPYASNKVFCHYYPSLKGIPAPSHRVAIVAEVNDWDGYESRTSLNSAIWNGGEVGKEGNQRPVARYHGTPDRRGLHFFFLDGSAALVFPTNNDWTQSPVCAPLKGTATEGYFYHSAHFANLKNGTLIAQ